jgi:hypothetical protein
LYFLTHAIEQHELTRHTEDTGKLIHDSARHASKIHARHADKEVLFPMPLSGDP